LPSRFIGIAVLAGVLLEWASQIVGGAFDNFTGVWHLEGTLETTG
jgi:hypothetical protein